MTPGLSFFRWRWGSQDMERRKNCFTISIRKFWKSARKKSGRGASFHSAPAILKNVASVAEAVSRLESGKFKGLKIYPKLGYEPGHDLLRQKLYPLCQEQRIPVLTHCSEGGIKHKNWNKEECDAVTAPHAYKDILTEFPNLKLCLAHFGGDRAWKQYRKNLRRGHGPQTWVDDIVGMIRSGDFPNLWTDISYTIFNFQENFPALKDMLKDDVLRARVLFGSDFYMIKQEQETEKEISKKLRGDLTEAVYRQIAETNPAIWLG